MLQNLQIFCSFLHKAAVCLLIINTVRTSASEKSPVLRPGVAFLPQNKPLRIVDKHWIIFSNYNLLSYESFLKKITALFTGFEILLKELEDDSKSIEITENPLTEEQKENILAEFHEDTKLLMESEFVSRNKFLSVCHQKRDFSEMSEMSKYMIIYKELTIKLQNYKYIINQELHSLSLHSYTLSNTQEKMDEIRMWIRTEEKCPQISDENYLEHIFKYYFGQHITFDVKHIKETVHHYENLRATVISNETFVETMKIINQLENCLTTLQNTEHLMISFADRLIAAINGIDMLIYSCVGKLKDELNDLLNIVTYSMISDHRSLTKATYKYKNYINDLTKYLDNGNSYFSNLDLLETAKVELHSCNNLIIHAIILYIPTPEQYPLFKALSTPISVPDGYLQYKEVPHYLAHINNTVLEFNSLDWKQCKSSANYYICPESYRIYFPGCMWNVYTIKKEAVDLPPGCQTQLVQSYQPLVNNIFGKNKMLYSLPRETPFTIYCKNKTRSLLMLNGTGYVVLPHKCELMLGSLFTTFSPELWFSVYRNLRFHMSNPDVSVIKRKDELKLVLFNIEHQLKQLENEHNILKGYDPEVEMEYSFVYLWTILCIFIILLLLVVAFWPH